MDFSDWLCQYDVLKEEIEFSAKAAERIPRPTDAEMRRDPAEAMRRIQIRQEAIVPAQMFPKDPVRFYDGLLAQILENITETKQRNPDDMCGTQCVSFNQASVELNWHRMRKPYYKLYPGIVGMLSQSDIRVPAKYVHAPLPSILVRLPKDHGIVELHDESGSELRCILVDEAQPDDIRRVSELLGFSDGLDRRRFTFWMDFGESETARSLSGRRLPVIAFQCVGIEDEEATFEENLASWMGHERLDWDKGVRIPDEALVTAVRLAVGACLLATNADKVVEHDVLNKHVARYRNPKTSPEERERLVKKAGEYGKNGWLMGREISLPGHYGCKETTDESGRVSRELTHSHLRRGHFHTVLHGPGRSLARIDWFAPTVVRPDLPAAEKSSGYKTT